MNSKKRSKKLILKYSLQARNRLIEIGQYTEQNWGGKQRGIYLKTLMKACDELLLNPSIGKSRDEVFNGIRSIRAEKHIIFYFVQEDSVLIADILHETMEPSLHFH